MATSAALGSLIMADGFDLSCYLKSVEVAGNVDMLDNTALCATASRTYQPGLVERTITGESFFAYDGTTDANSIDKTFSDAMDASANKHFLIAPNGYSAVGDFCFICNTKQANYSISETVGELIMLSFEAKTCSDSTHGNHAAGARILMHATQTGTANETSIDNGAASTGYLAQCHVSSASSLSSVTVKVQHSTDNSSWADLCTFTTFTAIGAEQKFSTSTSVNRYRRAIVSAWSGTSAKITVGFKSAWDD